MAADKGPKNPFFIQWILSAWNRFSSRGGIVVAAAFVLVVAVGVVIMWFILFSGLGDPAGFVYNQF